MKKQYNFAVIGCGHIAQRHAIEASKQGKILAVCDANIDKAKFFANQYQCNYYTTLDELLRKEPELDIACICTPNHLHATQTIQCLKSDLNVICEKPMAIKIEDARKMISTSESTGKSVFVVKQLRYYPHIQFIKSLLTNHQLGKIFSFHINCFWNRPETYYLAWKGKKETDGGTLFTQFSHYIDLILWLFGDVHNFQFLAKNYSHPKIEFEDTGILSYTMSCGTIGSFNYNVTATRRNLENAISIFAEKASFKLSGPFLNHFEYFESDSIEIPEHLMTKNNLGTIAGHEKVFENILNALEGRENATLKAEESIKSIELIEKIYSSINNNSMK